MGTRPPVAFPPVRSSGKETMSHLRHLRRLVAALATAGLAVTLLGSPSSATAPTSSPAGKGGTWLVGQLRHGLIHNGQFHFDDYGLTADTALALHAVGHHRKALFDIRRALARNVNAYTAYKTDRYAGPTAKLLVVAEDNGAAIRQLRRRQPGHPAGGPSRQEGTDPRPDPGQVDLPRLRQHHRPGLRGPGPARGPQRLRRPGPGLPARAAVRAGAPSGSTSPPRTRRTRAARARTTPTPT